MSVSTDTTTEYPFWVHFTCAQTLAVSQEDIVNRMMSYGDELEITAEIV